jgi:two-component system, chemotaxis family, chemotaxis protein CheY
VSFLVVEGSPSTRDALCYALLSFGVKGVPAATRAAAWDAINAAADLEGVIVDIDNKDVDGIRLVADLRQNPRTRGLAVVVHTVQSGKDFVLQMIEAGVAGYLLKPFNPSTAHEKLSPILAKISTHNGERRHFRVRPDPEDLARAHFRLSGVPQLISGKILDVSLGGMAAELLTPPAEGVLQTGTRIPRLEFALGGRELAPAATVVLLKSRVLALKFDSIAPADTRSLERYIFKKISS